MTEESGTESRGLSPADDEKPTVFAIVVSANSFLVDGVVSTVAYNRRLLQLRWWKMSAADNQIPTRTFVSDGWINRWDLVLLPLVIGVLFVLGWAGRTTPPPSHVGATVSLNPGMLPLYALKTTLRMLAALVASFLFTFVVGTLAAKSRRAEKILVPLLDILQSVPILGFLSIAVVWFVTLLPGTTLGAEFAAVFAIFTSQVWNMTFSFYYSLKRLPRDLVQAADLFGLSHWQRFVKLELPYAMPGLVWNTMMSVSGGWFFVVASEAITVAHHKVMLPGVGSYIALAIQHRDLIAIGYAILAMLITILLYDQLAFRPLVAWSEKFKNEQTSAGTEPQSWMLDLIRRSRLLARIAEGTASFGRYLRSRQQLAEQTRRRRQRKERARIVRLSPRLGEGLWSVLIGLIAVATIIFLGRYLLAAARLATIAHVFLLGFYTLVRVVVLTILASLIWVPVGIHIGLRPKLARLAQPMVLFLSAFPANLLFPVAVFVIVRYSLNPDIWLSPLLILGTQWYILFNVIAGAAQIPGDLREAADNIGLHGWRRWRRLYLPAVFPQYLTGGLTAAGGAWNASVVAELVSWGNSTIKAHGIGAYINQETSAGHQSLVVLGIAVMSLYVILMNRLVWKRLYRFAQERMAEH